MDELEESREIVTDMALAERQFKYFNKQLRKRIGAIKNDEVDQSVVAQVFDRRSELNGPGLVRTSSKYGRALAGSSKETTIQIMKLEEPYPTSCQNHGQLSSQTQRYYMCRALQKTEDPFRVTKETYLMLLQNYTDMYSCYTKNVTKNVCVCPKGFIDFECATMMYKKCFVNITDPPFYAGCKDRPDTPSYLFSLPGYDPCFPLDFSRSHEIKYQLNCRVIDDRGLVDQ